MSDIVCECSHGIDAHGDNGCIYCQCCASRAIMELNETIANLREQLCKMASTIGELMSNLPDSIHPTNESWDWCWDDLDGDAQEEVKTARFGAAKLLSEIDKGDSDAQ